MSTHAVATYIWDNDIMFYENSTFNLIDGGNHYVMVDHTERVYDIIVEALEPNEFLQ